jgi:hypothetical protein
LMILSSSAFSLPTISIINFIGSAVFVTVIISGMDYIMSWLRRVRAQKINN